VQKKSVTVSAMQIKLNWILYIFVTVDYSYTTRWLPNHFILPLFVNTTWTNKCRNCNFHSTTKT